MNSTAYTVNGTTEVGEIRHLPWGHYRFTSGATPTSYKYTGQREEASLGLYYYGARWYDPALGRFIQPDTIVPNPGDAQAFDRYAYALNNPLKYVDPTGHTPEIDPGTGGSLPPNIQNLYTAFYLQFKEHPIAALYDGDWALFAQDFVAATEAAGAAGLVEYGAVAEQMANTLAGRGKAATGGLMSTGDALRFFLYGLDNDFQQIVAQKENERVGQLMGVLGMSFMFSSALGGPCSFASDTLVMTADGLKPITEIKVGDLVYAYHEATGEVGLYPVTAELAHLDREIVTLVINGERIVTTPEHPFYTTVNGWTPAGALQVGDEIRRANGVVGTVQTITVVKRPQVMYNLTVADAHTFFVGNGQWLVHNQCPFSTTTLRANSLVPDKNGFTRAGRALQKHAGRAGSPWQPFKPSGTLNQANYNNEADQLVQSLLTNPATTVTSRNHFRYGTIYDFRASDGRGLRYDGSGNFIGFLD